jgi:hypothetical protein
MIEFNKPKIDSTSLLIPMEKVEIIDSTFLQQYIKVYKETGESIELDENDIGFYTNNVYKDDNGIKTKYAKRTLRFDFKEGGSSTDCLHLVITSKMLESSYFDAINKENIKLIYDYLIAQKVVYVSFEDFMLANVTDIDICKDLPSTTGQYKIQNTILKRKVASSKLRYLKPFANGNIQFNERHSATPASPFLKFYFKSEQITKDQVFLNTYLLEYLEDINKGIQRVEGTVKNAKHKNKLNMQARTLKELLDIPMSELERIHRALIKPYFDIMKIRVKQAIKPNELIMLRSWELLIKYGSDKTEIYNSFASDFEGMAKTRIKKKFNELMAILEDRKDLKSYFDEIANNEDKKVVRQNLINLGIYEDEN